MYDYHTHTNFSEDGRAPMTEMICAAVKAGLKEIAITDHYDPDYPDPNWPSNLDLESYHKEMEDTSSRYKEKIKLIKGIEIGIQHGKTLDKCRKVVTSYNYDFVLGSFHCAEGFDLAFGGFFDHRSVEEATVAFYQYNYDCLSVYDDYDVLGHINVVDRYGPYIPASNSYMDILSEVLSLLISKGKGIEINTSSFRYGMGEHTTPTEEMLKRYQELGGEIITIGSDAHAPEHLGYGLEWGYEKLKSVGFRYVTTFNQRQPNFIKL
ncbi:MAG: histidinol-phosphatase HisJ family protein [Eubacteriales bacterium]|nr:histidinol-phosphatase HisJ family protein [Eubacteriales bacterium]MDD4583148.1 histidinol-phosphatase HisJ family protein [Eubacteriales bacterium]